MMQDDPDYDCYYESRPDSRTPVRSNACVEIPLSLKVMLHWSTCNANLQRQFATHVFSHEFADMIHF